jgi:hypothetical protein
MLLVNQTLHLHKRNVSKRWTFTPIFHFSSRHLSQINKQKQYREMRERLEYSAALPHFRNVEILNSFTPYFMTLYLLQ